MGLNFTNDILDFFATDIATDTTYQAGGDFNLSNAAAGAAGVDHVTVGTAGTYATKPTATASTGTATFATRMKLLSGSSIAAAGTGYVPTEQAIILGGTRTTPAIITIATCKLVSAAIAAGGTGYGSTQTFTATVAGGTHGAAATLSITSNGGGVATTINSISAAGSYTVLPTLAANAATGGTGSGLTLNLVFGVNTFTVSQAGVYSILPSNPISLLTEHGTGFTLNGSWGVQSIVVTDGGSYYGSAPSVVFSAGSATATAVVGITSQFATDSQKLLTFIEVLRSYVDEVTTPAQLKDLHEVLRKMMSAMKFGSASDFDASDYADRVVASAMKYIANRGSRLHADL